MILVGLGSNLLTAGFPSLEDLLEAALLDLGGRGVAVVGRSSWYRSAPVPPSEQPWFVNGVARVETERGPHQLLATLHALEAEYGRVRSQRNESRALDLDLLAYDAQVVHEMGGLVIPHPRLHERKFVLCPIAELAPDWRHPVSDLTAAEMLAQLPPGQEVETLSGRPSA